jgi:hypothetical protein
MIHTVVDSISNISVVTRLPRENTMLNWFVIRNTIKGDQPVHYGDVYDNIIL